MAGWTAPLNQPQLARAERQARGVFYTPDEVVQFVVDRCLAHHSDDAQPRVLDPACGAGAFLVQAARRLLGDSANQTNSPRPTLEARLQLVQRSIFGIDIDPDAVAACRGALAEVVLGPESADVRSRRQSAIASRLSDNICVADALTDDLPPSFAAGSFHAVIGNPPYVNIRQLVKAKGRDYVAQLRERYRTARGNFDLYVAFLERAMRLARPGGRCGFVVPNKFAGLSYAAECRRLLLDETRLDCIVDLSESRAFGGAGVYPWVVLWTNERAEPAHRVEWRIARLPDDLQASSAGSVRQVDQQALQADGLRIASAVPHPHDESMVRLADLATLECGTAGYSASRVAQCLMEAAGDTSDAEVVHAGSPCADFIVSGNIDRYAILPGDVRYLGRKYTQPIVALDDERLTARQRRLFRQRKIVVSGMTRRLEAAYDSIGLALGVQVYAILPPAADVFYVLGLLNSRWLSHWFRQRFAAKQLAGGFLAINKSQLAQLPIRRVAASHRAERRRQRAIAEAAEALSTTGLRPATLAAELDRRIDAQVYALYRLTDAQIDEVETAFTPSTALPKRRAA